MEILDQQKQSFFLFSMDMFKTSLIFQCSLENFRNLCTLNVWILYVWKTFLPVYIKWSMQNPLRQTKSWTCEPFVWKKNKTSS